MIVITGLTVVVCAAPFARSVRAQNAVEERFNQLDSTGDGKITPDELSATEFFKRLDLDGNGEITKPEAARALARGAFNDVLKPVPMALLH